MIQVDIPYVSLILSMAWCQVTWRLGTTVTYRCIHTNRHPRIIIVLDGSLLTCDKFAARHVSKNMSINLVLQMLVKGATAKSCSMISTCTWKH